ncbi:MAG: hypothetical protein J6M53_07165 [Bacteroidaceae bacterium]|nr:hypothetical protein [Bacteroidaceae bacterium]
MYSHPSSAFPFGIHPIRTIDDVERMALFAGLLPFFENPIAGFSIAEHTPEELWFQDEDGPWEWKGPLIGRGSLAYGKFLHGKACFVSLELFPHFLNVRLAAAPQLSETEECILQALEAHGSLLSHELKKLCGFTRPHSGRTNPIERVERAKAPRKRNGHTPSFDTLMARLQMAGRVCIADFAYKYDREGRRYGWGVARYTTPSLMYGDELPPAACAPDASLRLLTDRLHNVLPDVPIGAVERLLAVPAKRL